MTKAVIGSQEGIAIPPSCVVALTAYCYSCRTPLAVFGWAAEGGRAKRTFIAGGLIQRPERHSSGFQRYGPPRRGGHGSPRHDKVSGKRYAWGSAISLPEFYANCHGCDRGQIVSSPDIAATQIGVLMSS